MIFKFPHLARGTTAVRWRVHDDRIIAAAALEFATGKLQAIVDNIADGSVPELAERSVLAAPLYHAFSSVHVAHRRARFRRRDRRCAGVPEKVQHVDRAGVIAWT